jgi:prevent-host-death family protein
MGTARDDKELNMARTWRASDARHKFTDVVDAAVLGEPQFVKRRDGRQVVVVSLEYFEKTRPTLKFYLLTEGVSDEGDDAFDRAMREIRAEGSPFVIPGTVDLSE